MTLTTHAATGILVAQWTNSPTLGFVFGIVSHYLTDAIPHGDEFIYWRQMHRAKDAFAISVVTIDVVMVLLLLYASLKFGSFHNQSLVIIAAFGGILPDLLMTTHGQLQRLNITTLRIPLFNKAFEFFRQLLQIHHTFHMLFHDLVRSPIRFRTGIFYQVVFILLYFKYVVLV